MSGYAFGQPDLRCCAANRAEGPSRTDEARTTPQDGFPGSAGVPPATGRRPAAVQADGTPAYRVFFGVSGEVARFS